MKFLPSSVFGVPHDYGNPSCCEPLFIARWRPVPQYRALQMRWFLQIWPIHHWLSPSRISSDRRAAGRFHKHWAKQWGIDIEEYSAVFRNIHLLKLSFEFTTTWFTWLRIFTKWSLTPDSLCWKTCQIADIQSVWLWQISLWSLRLLHFPILRGLRSAGLTLFCQGRAWPIFRGILANYEQV